MHVNQKVGNYYSKQFVVFQMKLVTVYNYLHEPVGADFSKLRSEVFLRQLFGVSPVEEVEIQSYGDWGVLPQSIAVGFGSQAQFLTGQVTLVIQNVQC
jgi:hypothetical protein